MDSRLLEYLADPHDGSALELHTFAGNTQNIQEGVLRNIATNRWYPIVDGIPSLFIDALRENYDSFISSHRNALVAAGCALVDAADLAEPISQDGDFSRIDNERRARDEQAEHYDHMLSLKLYELIETPTYRQALGADRSTPLLEAGCGTGRFTALFADMAREVVAVDMSRDSILRNRQRHIGQTAAPVHYVHADLTHLPLRSGAFGRIAHCGVYEHIPSRELRSQFLQHARRVARPDGVLLLSAYRYGGITKLFGKQGEHPGNIPFTRFTEAELRAEVEPYFNIESFRPNLGVYMSMLVGRPC